MTSKTKTVLAALALIAALPLLAQELTHEPGTNRKGSDYESFRTNSLDVCRRSCARDSRCRAYTFNSVDSLCYLKERVPGPSRDSRTVSGVKEGHDSPFPGNQLTEEPGTNRKGSDYDTFRTNLEVCRRSCARDSRCRAFTFNSVDSLCYLKDRVPGPSRDSRTVSGVKGGSSSPGDDLTEEEGIDYRGGYYTRFQARGLRDCKDQCRRDSRCISYTYDLNAGLCYLEDKIGKREQDRDKVSGIKRRP
jgi:PAN domain